MDPLEAALTLQALQEAQALQDFEDTTLDMINAELAALAEEEE